MLDVKGKRVVLTGTFSEKRSVIKRQLTALGATVSTSVSKNTDLILVGSEPGSKLAKAKDLGIAVYSEKKLNTLMRSTSVKTSSKMKKVAKKKVAKKKVVNGSLVGEYGKDMRCPVCASEPADGIVDVDVNSVRHWISYLEAGHPDVGNLSNRDMRAMPAKEFVGYFGAMEFIGWHSITPGWVHRVSPLKRYNSNSYIFRVSAKSNVKYWGVDEVKAHLGKKPSFTSSARLRAFF